MNEYNVGWYRGEAKRPEKNILVEAVDEQEAESKARQELGIDDDRLTAKSQFVKKISTGEDGPMAEPESEIISEPIPKPPATTRKAKPKPKKG